MNKKFLISMFLILAVCTAGCNLGSNIKTSKSKQSKQMSKVAKSKNSVPQTYEEWVAKNGEPLKAAPRKSVTTNTNTQNVAQNPVQTATPKPKKELMGEEIPDWVYKNSVPSNTYYNLINSPYNIVFFTYADCPIGRGRRDMIKRAISRAGVSGKFVLNADLHPEGSSQMISCPNLLERIPDSQLDAVVKKRQGNGPSYAIETDNNGNYCIPTLVNGKIPDGACRCVSHYILGTCEGSICIINPKAKRIVTVSPNEEELVKKLNELKNNW